MVIRYVWDFRGYSAEGTAAHFRTHVDEFLSRNGLDGCVTGLDNPGLRHWACWCDTPEAHQAAVEKALRPHRRAGG